MTPKNGNPAVRTGITSLADALASASVVLTAAVICAGAASADPSPSQQDLQDLFVTQLAADQIPVVDNLPALVARAHQICAELDGGASVYAVVDEEMNGMFEQNPEYRQVSARVHRTAVRFIATSIQVYCPSHFYDPYISTNGFSLLGPVAGVPHQTLPPRIGAVRMPHLMDGGVFASVRYPGNQSGGEAHATKLAWLIEAIPSGDITQPDPPQVPPPAPPTAQIQTPPLPVAPPPLPKQPPPPPQKPPPTPQQPPPPPQQVEPPAVGPQPGDAAGGGGGGSADGGGNGGGGNGGGSARGGGGPGPSPAPSMPPGFVRLAP